MRCGTPVIASDIPVFKEVCGKAALFFDPHNAGELAEKILAIQDSSTRDSLSLAGLERAKLFSWDNAADKIEKIYSALVN
jgi:glycosyltransferase involved in cell wall biosynthesis